MSETRARRFLNAFAAIEAVLDEKDKRADKYRYERFVDLLDSSTLLTDAQKKRLRSMARLRNAIVHNAYDGDMRPIADPREQEVAWVEEQAKKLEAPPFAFDVLKCHPPTVLGIDSDITEFFMLVSPPQNFSQAPVQTDSGEYALITTNAVARWVASAYSEEQEGALIDRASIGDVLGHSEAEDVLLLRDRGLTAVDAVRLFGGARQAIPQAILLTNSGSHSEKPLGIVVRADIPKLLQSLGV